jgi:tetratricopeptide (TPR) repeat protein
MPGVWLEYLRIAALPFDLSTERMHSSTLVYAGWPVAVGLAALLVRARNLPHVREVAGGVAWFAAMLAPAAVAITSSGVAADRYIAAPLLGLLFAAVAGARILVGARASLRRPLLVVGGLWGALLLIVAWRQVPVWRTNETLYAHATVMTPGSSDAFYRLGYLAATRDDWDEAIPLLEHSVELDGRNVRALNNLAVGYLRTHREADAEQTLQRAVDVSPAAYRSWFNLGVARLALGKRDEGCAAVRRALEIQPAYEQARQVQAQSCRK